MVDASPKTNLFRIVVDYLRSHGHDELKEVGKTVRIESIAMLHHAQGGQLVYYDGTDSDRVEGLTGVALLCTPDLECSNEDICYLRVKDPKLAFYEASHLFEPSFGSFEVDDEACARFPGAWIAKGCAIDPGATVHPNVVIRAGSTLSEGCVVESGCVIGATGQMWTWNQRTGGKTFLNMTGGTVIGPGVMLSANISVVRGACGENTTIGARTMISPASAVGHGAMIGEDVHIANAVALGGGCRIGDRSFLGSGAIVQPDVRLPADSVLATAATLTRTPSEPGVFVGTPAKRTGPVRDDLAGVPARRSS